MGLTILNSRAEIKAAIATMNPIAQEATKMFAMRIMQSPEILDKNDELTDVGVECAAQACENWGKEPEEFDAFMESNLIAIFNVAVSIVVYEVQQARKREWLKWVGLGGAAAIGAIIGAFFG